MDHQRRVEELAMIYGSAVRDAYDGGGDWQRTPARQRLACEAAAQRFLSSYPNVAARDIFSAWRLSMLQWCDEHDEVLPHDATTNWARLSRQQQLAEMFGLRAMADLMAVPVPIEDYTHLTDQQLQYQSAARDDGLARGVLYFRNVEGNQHEF